MLPVRDILFEHVQKYIDDDDNENDNDDNLEKKGGGLFSDSVDSEKDQNKDVEALRNDLKKYFTPIDKSGNQETQQIRPSPITSEPSHCNIL